VRSFVSIRPPTRELVHARRGAIHVTPQLPTRGVVPAIEATERKAIPLEAQYGVMAEDAATELPDPPKDMSHSGPASASPPRAAVVIGRLRRSGVRSRLGREAFG
jgi:hypothetical protein